MSDHGNVVAIDSDKSWDVDNVLSDYVCDNGFSTVNETGKSP